MIKYIKGDLFENETDILLHACNCQGIWGRGIAKEFRNRFPEAHNKHSLLKYSPAQPGSIQILNDKNRTIVCLFTSFDYGKKIDDNKTILENTEKALDLLGKLADQLDPSSDPSKSIMIASPKINAGLFRVLWSKTENLIEDFLKKYPKFGWTVYHLD